MLAPAMALAGCGTGIFKPEPAAVIGKPCPPLKKYSTAEQLQACAELKSMCPAAKDCGGVRAACPSLMLPVIVDDYGLMRAQCP